MIAVEKAGGGSIDPSALKANIDEFKKEMASLRSIDLRIFFGGRKDQPLKVHIATILNGGRTLGGKHPKDL